MTDAYDSNEQLINQEELTSNLLASLDAMAREYDFENYDVMLSRFFKPSIYKLITHADLDKIYKSDKPKVTQFNILKPLLPKIIETLRADSVFLLKLTTPDEDKDEELKLTRKVQTYQFLTLVDEEHHKDSNPAYEMNVDEPITEETWRSFGDQLDIDVKTFQYDPNRVETETDDYQQKPDSEANRHNYPLPMPLHHAEIVFIRIGEFTDLTQYIFVIHKYINSDASRLIYASDLSDLLASRLTEFHHQVLHRLQEIAYDNQRSAFVQDILHQVRNSIGGLLESIQYMQKRYDNDNLQLELDILRKLVLILGDTAESSYLAAEKRSIFDVYDDPPVVFYGEDWVEMLNHTIEMFSGEVAAHGLRDIYVKDSTIAQLPPIRINEQLIRLLVFNLLQNAIKYSFKDSHTRIGIRADSRNGYVRLIVMNYGKGFLPQERERIFERHYRSEVIQKTHGTGTGIGLFLCRQIMTEHGGDISVSIKHAPQPDIPNMYQVAFSIRFPIVKAPMSKKRRKAKDGNEISRESVYRRSQPITIDTKHTILYVEDDLAHHPHMIPLLSEYFNVIHAPTGKQALDFLLKDRATNQYGIRLVLLDVNLDNDRDRNQRFSGMRGGVELARAILDEEKFDLPVIGWTAISRPEIREELNEIGIDKVLIRTHPTNNVEKLSQLILKTIHTRQY